MNSAHLELHYRRGDGKDVVLLTELYAVRPLEVGGAADGLRLPGAPKNAHFCTLHPVGENFQVRRQGAEHRVLLNDADLTNDTHILTHGDTLRVGDYQLIFREGEPTDPETLLDTPQRWKQRLPEGARREGDEEPKTESTPYVKEFELSIRPLTNSDQHEEIEKRAAKELLRVVRSDEAERLEEYCRFLWTVRVAALSQMGKDKEAEELCAHAIDLYPQDAILLAWLGSMQLKRKDWKAAAASFERCQRVVQHSSLRILHMARVGLRLANDELAHAAAPERWKPVTPHSADWNVPTIELEAPGDEIIYWYLARRNRLFGPEDATQFRFLGQFNDPKDDATTAQRWEVFDQQNGRLYRRVLRIPTPAHADPSLCVEISILRQHLWQNDSTWYQGLVDLSEHYKTSQSKAPVIFEPSVIAILAKSVTKQTPYVRVGVTRHKEDMFSLDIKLVAALQPTDIVYEQGSLKVAVAQGDVELLAGARLSWLKDAEGEGFCLESPNFARKLVLRRQETKKSGRSGNAIWGAVFIVALALGILVWALLTTLK